MRGVYVGGEWWEKELEKCKEFFFFAPDRVRIYTRTLQYQYNLILNCNEQYKEGIGYVSNTLWESNRSKSDTKSIIINNKSEHKINPN